MRNKEEELIELTKECIEMISCCHSKFKGDELQLKLDNILNSEQIESDSYWQSRKDALTVGDKFIEWELFAKQGFVNEQTHQKYDHLYEIISIDKAKEELTIVLINEAYTEETFEFDDFLPCYYQVGADKKEDKSYPNDMFNVIERMYRETIDEDLEDYWIVDSKYELLRRYTDNYDRHQAVDFSNIFENLSDYESGDFNDMFQIIFTMKEIIDNGHIRCRVDW